MIHFLLLANVISAVVWHNDGKTKPHPTITPASLVTHERKPILSDGRPIFQSDATILRNFDVPKQMSSLLDQLFKARDAVSHYRKVFQDVAQQSEDSNDKPFPTLKPNQAGFLPKLRGEVLCGGPDSLIQCASLGDITSAFGNNLLDILEKSNLYHVSDEAFNLIDGLYKSATLGVTDSLIDTVEMEPLVQTLEHVYRKLISENFNILQPKDLPAKASASSSPGHVKPGKQNLYTSSFEHVIDETIYNSLDRLAVTEPKIIHAMDKVGDFVTCDAFPGCRALKNAAALEGMGNPKKSGGSSPRVLVRSEETVWPQIEAQTLASTDLSGAIRIPKSIYIHGFTRSCLKQHACIASYKEMIPELFDGLYSLDVVSLDELVYTRNFVDDLDFDAVRRWKSLYKDCLPMFYLWLKRVGDAEWTMAITAEMPLTSKKHEIVQSRPPYAELTSTCSEPDPIKCSQQSYWMFKSFTTFGCSHGLKQRSTCIYPILAEAIPAKIVQDQSVR